MTVGARRDLAVARASVGRRTVAARRQRHRGVAASHSTGVGRVLGVRPWTITMSLGAAAVAVVAATVLGRAMRDISDVGGHNLLLRSFAVNGEGTVWTWFSLVAPPSHRGALRCTGRLSSQAA